MKVLVVEDDPNLRMLWKEVFDQAGHDTRAVGNAVAARKVLLTQPQDLILLDLCLGEDTGLSVATTATYVNADCKVIVVTGSHLFPKGELFDMSASIAAVMRKPVEIRELLAVADHITQEPKDEASVAFSGHKAAG